MERRPLANSVLALLKSKLPESGTLDYKRMPYDKTEGGRKEFAKDVAAFANRDGGMLVIGVAEKAGLPDAVVGVPDADIDAEIRWLESVSRSGISPHPTGLTIAPVDVEGRQVIVVDVPAGDERPYEVPSAGSRFFVRDERSVRPMSREELVYTVLRRAGLRERIAEIADSRWQEFVSAAASPTRALGPGRGGSLLQIFPVFEHALDFRFDLPAVALKFQALHSFAGRDVSSARPRIDGLEYVFGPDEPAVFGGLVKLYRTGSIEYGDGQVFGFRAGRPIPGQLLMESVVGATRRGIRVAQELTGAILFYLDFRAASRRGEQISFYNMIYGDTGTIDRDELKFDPLELQLDEDWEADLAGMMRPLLDQIWQASGYLECGYFKDGVFAPGA